ncbi:MAG: hypothetical protein N4A49_07795 [Marinifilaceae bacterium]|jgi:hypothetical protein|nr:hypothetical protein [Marinifilaceae bacterium]
MKKNKFSCQVAFFAAFLICYSNFGSCKNILAEKYKANESTPVLNLGLSSSSNPSIFKNYIYNLRYKAVTIDLDFDSLTRELGDGANISSIKFNFGVLSRIAKSARLNGEAYPISDLDKIDPLSNNNPKIELQLNDLDSNGGEGQQSIVIPFTYKKNNTTIQGSLFALILYIY